MTERKLLEQALHALEKHALNKEPRLIEILRSRMKTPERESVVYLINKDDSKRVALQALNTDVKLKRSRRTA
jgi:hypothetical protein